MALDDIRQKQGRVGWWFNLAASVVILGVGGFLVFAAYSGWFGMRSPRVTLIAWLVVVYGVVRFLLYLWRHRGS